LAAMQIQAQNSTTVRANSSDISDNLDLKAVASIFGESADLADFERRLNDPRIQISNLDLNGDNKVDYLRVIETVEGRTHLIIIQSVLERDVYQDVATVEVERRAKNNIQVQVVGNAYLYGSNYIYEPVYVSRPVIYNVFWTNYYRPYCSPFYWSYYPDYYYAWNPYPSYRYHRNVNVYINVNNRYNYVDVRRSSRAENLYNSRRSDGYARQYPDRSFAQRNNASNRYELVQARSQGSRGQADGTRAAYSARGNDAVRSNLSSFRNDSPAYQTRGNSALNQPRSTAATRDNSVPAQTRNIHAGIPTRTANSTGSRGDFSSQTAAPSRPMQTSRAEFPARTNSERTQSLPQMPERSASPSNMNRSNNYESQRQSIPQQRGSTENTRSAGSRSGGSRG
ncbi:MAG TPA: hypothetical protein VFR70_11485, partial [Flavobacterium sp.]|nr:hypothetical protein [Flavobacterium sp.]